MVSEILTLATTIMGSAMGASIFLQTAKILKRKSAADVSIPTYIVFTFGAALWFVYGMSKGDYPLMIANAIGTTSSFSVLVAALKYQKKSSKR